MATQVRELQIFSHCETEIFYSSFCGGGPQGCNMRFTFMVSVLESQQQKRNGAGTHLAHLKFDSPDRLSIRDGEIRVQGRMSDYRRERVPMLVC